MARALPSLLDFPIPRDVAPGAGWSAHMRDLADLVGAYETLLICEQFGGQDVHVPADPEKNPFRGMIGACKAKAVSWTYRRQTIAVPTARYALALARRAPIVAAVRSGDLTVTDMARIIGVRRDYASRLVNGTSEGVAVAPAPRFSARRDPRQLDMFTVEAGG